MKSFKCDLSSKTFPIVFNLLSIVWSAELLLFHLCLQKGWVFKRHHPDNFKANELLCSFATPCWHITISTIKMTTETVCFAKYLNWYNTNSQVCKNTLTFSMHNNAYEATTLSDHINLII